MTEQTEHKLDGNRTAEEIVENLSEGDTIVRRNKEDKFVQRVCDDILLFDDDTWMKKNDVKEEIVHEEVVAIDGGSIFNIDATIEVVQGANETDVDDIVREALRNHDDVEDVKMVSKVEEVSL